MIDVAVAVVAIGVAGGLWGKVRATLPSETTDGIAAEEILSVTLHVPSSERQQVARAQAAIVEKLRGEPDVRAVTFATALPRMDHPSRLMDVDHDAAAVAAPAGPFKVRTARIAIDFFSQLEQPLVAGRGFDLHPDGDRFLLSLAADAQTDARADKVVFVFNFFDELRRLAPVTGR